MRAKLEQLLGRFDKFAYENEHIIYWWFHTLRGQIRFDLAYWGLGIAIHSTPKILVNLGPLEFTIFFEDYSKWKVIFR